MTHGSSHRRPHRSATAAAVIAVMPLMQPLERRTLMSTTLVEVTADPPPTQAATAKLAQYCADGKHFNPPQPPQQRFIDVSPSNP